MQITRQYSLHRAFADRALDTVQKDMARLQEQLATARRINRPSDDPAGLAVSKKLTEALSRNEQWQRNIDSASTWLAQGQDALNTVLNVMSDLREKGVQSANAPLSDHDRSLLANEMKEIFGEMIDVLNYKFGDHYIFSGTNLSEKPFVQDGLAVTYAGNDGPIVRRIGEDSEVAINVGGSELITIPGGGTVPEAVARLIEAIEDGSAEEITAALAGVEEAHDYVLSQATSLGSRSRRISIASDQLRDVQLALTAERSHIEDTDYVSALYRFQQLQVSHQAALKTTASIIQTSLLDYLR